MDRQQKNGPALLDGRHQTEAAAAAGADGSSDPDRAAGPAGAQHWLDLATSAYEASHNFVEANLKKDWEENERAFQSLHPSGSKYLSDSYKYRSKLFRPRTRAAMRQSEAAAAASFFANEDLVNVKAGNPEDRENVASAELNKELLQYRLSTPGRQGIPWFLTCMGAFQLVKKYGFVVSEQHWLYQHRTRKRPQARADADGAPVIDEAGRPVIDEVDEIVTIADRPEVTVYDPENVYLSRAADWRDPLNSSPYVQLRFPMFLGDVLEMMANPDPKTGAPPFLPVDAMELKSAGRVETWDSTRQAREGDREDSKDPDIAIDEYRPIWIFKNFMRWQGEDWYYLTAGTRSLLTTPRPVSEVFRHCPEGERPLVMGYGLLEALKLYPDSHVKLLRELQKEANDITNLRIDNWRLAITQRFKVKRGKRVDLRQVARGAPGSSILVDDMEDIDSIQLRDYTASAFREQTRVDLDFDSLAGQMNAGTIQANRSLNETVGGMEMMKGGADMVAEYDLRVFSETWLEPVVRHLIRLEQTYENDETIVGLAAQKARLWRRFGVDRITDEMLDRDLTVKANAGIGATDPMARLQKFQVAVDTLAKIFPEGELKQFSDIREIVKEVFAPLGYRDGDRFFKFDDQDPMIGMLTQQLEQLQETLDKRVLDIEGKKAVAQINAYARIMQEMAANNGRLSLETERYINEINLLGAEQEHERELNRHRNLHEFRQSILQAMTQREVAQQRGQGGGQADRR